MKSLEAFETVSRHMSMSKAADELGVTQSAVSHQLHHLSEQIGELLLEKSGRGVVLTSAGRRFAERMQDAFNQINSSLDDVIGTNKNTVRLAICSSFAPGWLIGRLSSFYQDHPSVPLQLHMYAQDPDLTDRVADAFVTTLPTVAGFWAMRIQSERLVPVYSSSRSHLVPGKLPLITTTVGPAIIGGDWLAYCEVGNLSLDVLHTGMWLQVTHYIMALDMARQGLGIALVPDFLAEAEIASGALELLSKQSLPTNDDYYLCVKNSRKEEPNLKVLVQWFRKQISPPGNGTSKRSHEKDS